MKGKGEKVILYCISEERSEKTGDNLLEFEEEEEEQSLEEIKRKQDEEFGDFLRNRGQQQKEKKEKGE